MNKLQEQKLKKIIKEELKKILNEEVPNAEYIDIDDEALTAIKRLQNDLLVCSIDVKDGRPVRKITWERMYKQMVYLNDIKFKLKNNSGE